MNHGLTSTQLDQEVAVTLPLRALLLLGVAMTPAAARFEELKAERPTVGCKGVHGIYAGIARADEHGGDHIIEVLDTAMEPATWQDAMDWAASIGGTLPTRKEQALLFANVPELFEKEAYWSCETHAGDAGYAWSQSFGYGGQYGYHKSSSVRARPVRRLNIE